MLPLAVLALWSAWHSGCIGMRTGEQRFSWERRSTTTPRHHTVRMSALSTGRLFWLKAWKEKKKG